MNHRRQNPKNMTHEEIENAMKRYLDNGGTIKHLNSTYDNSNLNYDSMDHEERQMVYEITGVKNSGVKSTESAGSGTEVIYRLLMN